MRQIKNIRHQLPPVMIFQPVCTLDVYVCVERACLLIDMTSYKDAETPFLRICLRLEAEEFNRSLTFLEKFSLLKKSNNILRVKVLRFEIFNDFDCPYRSSKKIPDTRVSLVVRKRYSPECSQ